MTFSNVNFGHHPSLYRASSQASLCRISICLKQRQTYADQRVKQGQMLPLSSLLFGCFYGRWACFCCSVLNLVVVGDVVDLAVKSCLRWACMQLFRQLQRRPLLVCVYMKLSHTRWSPENSSSPWTRMNSSARILASLATGMLYPYRWSTEKLMVSLWEFISKVNDFHRILLFNLYERLL